MGLDGLRVELNVAAAGATKCSEWNLLPSAHFDPAEEALGLRRTARPGCLQYSSMSDIRNVPAFHCLLTLGAAWGRLRHGESRLKVGALPERWSPENTLRPWLVEIRVVHRPILNRI
jgi:hypothetical protein